MAGVSKGTEPTPPQLTARYSLNGEQNMHRLQSQLLQQGASTETIIKFADEAMRVKNAPGALPGQIQPISEAARTIGAELHWID
jgi:hypothetical protein